MKISGWFRRNNTLMAQAKDAYRQLQEAWYDRDEWRAHAELDVEVGAEWQRKCVSLEGQLHRVALERDEERERRLKAEDALLDRYLDDELKRDRDRFRDDLNAIYEWLAVEFPDAFASLRAKVVNPDALLTTDTELEEEYKHRFETQHEGE